MHLSSVQRTIVRICSEVVLVEERGEAGDAAPQLRVILLLLDRLRTRLGLRTWDSVRAAVRLSMSMLLHCPARREEGHWKHFTLRGRNALPGGVISRIKAVLPPTRSTAAALAGSLLRRDSASASFCVSAISRCATRAWQGQDRAACQVMWHANARKTSEQRRTARSME